MMRSIALALLAAALALPAPAHALFHLVSIREVVSGFGGDPALQYVELSTEFGSQNRLSGTRLTAFNADGSVVTVLLVTPSDKPSSASFPRKILYGTSALTTAAGLVPDYTIPTGIPTPAGMICWGAPDFPAIPQNPPAWDASNPDNYVDCVAYGGYTGPTRTLSGTPSPLPPGDGTLALTRIAGCSDTGSNDNDFLLMPPGPCTYAASSCNDFGCGYLPGQCTLLGPDGCTNGNFDFANGEQCDDGNPIDGDGCDTDCTFTPKAPDAKTIEKCSRTVAKATTKFVRAKAKILSKCELAKLKGKLDAGIVCKRDDMKTVDQLAKAESKKVAAIDKACGGEDKLCGGNRNEEVGAGTIGFGSACPGFEGIGKCTGGTNAGDVCGVGSDCVGGGTCILCDAAIDAKTCGGATTCVDCVAAVATHQMNDLLTGGLVANDPSAQKVASKCQQEIQKSSWKFYQAKAKILQKCWDKRLLGKHGDTCPDTTAPDGSEAEKAAEKIAKAESKTVKKICKACGGDDKVCGGAEPDLALFDLYDPAPTCPAVTLPGPPFTDCGAITVGTVADLVACIECVAEFKIDCVTAIQVPSLTAYPSECQ